MSEVTKHLRWIIDHARTLEDAKGAARNALALTQSIPDEPSEARKLLDGTDLHAFSQRLFASTDPRETDTLIGEAVSYLEAQCALLAALQPQEPGRSE